VKARENPKQFKKLKPFSLNGHGAQNQKINKNKNKNKKYR
jgi:hypothetical protein